MARAGSGVPLTDAQRDEAERHLYLCERAAERFARKCRGAIPREEFLSDAYLGLIEATVAFEESRGVPLSLYAPLRVDGACLDLMRRLGGRGGRRRRVESLDHINPEVGRTYADLIPDREHAASPYSPEEHARLKRSLARLDHESRLALVRLYGLAGHGRRYELGDGEVETRAGVARRLGTYPYRVARAGRAALAKLRRIYEEADGPPPSCPPAERYRNAGRAPRGPIAVADARSALMAAIGAPRAAGSLDDLLDALPPVRRLVVELHYGLDGRMRPLAEVSRVLGRDAKTVRTAHKIAIQTMRRMAG